MVKTCLEKCHLINSFDLRKFLSFIYHCSKGAHFLFFVARKSAQIQIKDGSNPNEQQS